MAVKRRNRTLFDTVKPAYNGRKDARFHADHYNYRYYDIESKRTLVITKDEINKAGVELPERCFRALNDIKATGRLATPSENSDLLKLCSLSLSIWHGGPEGKLPFVPMDEYQAEFYINMVNAFTRDGKSKFDPERSKWCRYVKWVALNTRAHFGKMYKTQALLINAASERIDDMESIESNEEGKFWEEFEQALHLRNKEEKKKDK